LTNSVAVGKELLILNSEVKMYKESESALVPVAVIIDVTVRKKGDFLL